MKRILFDQNVPRKLARELAPHHVELAFGRGWSSLSNGDLIRAAEEAGFEILITADQNLAYQQSMSGRRLAIVILDTNRWPSMATHLGRVRDAVNVATPGSYHAITVFSAEGDAG